MVPSSEGSPPLLIAFLRCGCLRDPEEFQHGPVGFHKLRFTVRVFEFGGSVFRVPFWKIPFRGHYLLLGVLRRVAF